MITYWVQVIDWTRWFVEIGTFLAFCGFVVACGVTTWDLVRMGGDLNKLVQLSYYSLVKNARKYCLPAVVFGCLLLIFIPTRETLIALWG
jgi:hypothetical protein